jgi:DNA-binding SARP family transcriptional activator
VSPTCPNCGSTVAGPGACSECGFLLAAPDAAPVWEEQHWQVLVRPDREHFDRVDTDGVEFPEVVQTRRIDLTGDFVRIGRRSHSKNTSPEIDLSGSLEDVGVSHRHAVLMRQPDGSWAMADQGSTNGTYLGGDDDPLPPNRRVPLKDGDRIHVGAWTSITVERVDAAVRSDLEVPSKDTRGVGRGRHGMQVALLGPLVLTVGGSVVPLGSPKARAVLAILALRTGTAVSAGDLGWAIWGDAEPRTSDKVLQGHVSALRKVLPDGVIETTPQGYRLSAPKEVVDTFRFERRCVRGSELLKAGHPGAAVAELALALELWRGEPLPDLADGPTGAVETSRWSERRAVAEEDLFEGRLLLGDHAGVLPDLTAAAEAEPLRERRWSQLMLALYRSGRQADAVRAFQRFRRSLGEEHGLEPSAEIFALEQAVVLDQPHLRWEAPVRAGEPGS